VSASSRSDSLPYVCPHCSSRGVVAEDQVGKWVRCPKCQHTGQVPAVAQMSGFRAPRFLIARIAIWVGGLLWTVIALASYVRQSFLASAQWLPVSPPERLAWVESTALWVLAGFLLCWILERILQTFSQWE
jgi:predicted Zn finger-like uncharacterized protein